MVRMCLVLRLTLSLTMLLVTGCWSDSPPPIEDSPALAPLVWDRSAALIPEQSLYSICLKEEEREFNGWIRIRVEPGGDFAHVEWFIGADRKSETVSLDPLGQVSGLLSVSDPYAHSLLAATLTSPLFDRPVNMIEGWTATYTLDDLMVKVRVAGQRSLGMLAGYLIRWHITGDGVDVEVEALIDPSRALPLSVAVKERSPEKYVLEVTLEGLD